MSDDPIIEFNPRYGSAELVASGVRRLTARNVSPLTFCGTNSYLLGTHELTIVDPGPDDEAHVRDLLAVANAPIRQILLTHYHADHAGAARRLAAATGAEIIGAEPKAADPVCRPDRVVVDGGVETMEVGDLRVIATPGHTADHLCYDLPGLEVLFSGDHVMGWSTSLVVPPDGRMADYMTSLDRVAIVGERIFLPGHGDIIGDGPTRVADLRRHRAGREAAILRSLERWDDRSIEDIVAAVYIGLEPGLVGAAALSVRAHTDWLEERGLIRRAGDRLSLCTKS